ncbi:hypothetical protein [Nocardia rhizosphaerihabitans]|uniref:Nephrocystin 3-like N-terminal domain-containing protein n=1 Tax=Nocardia rhizosphaerihabitans TaxID=1691570 RepID=A0ABQ2L3B9_9NOCA|nr:hypothetical protein [Nocardia rhizosphaerihabitans]GGO01162.1 hypothetical protein GCM10011610_70760 [Nocardia rhizosphaerihabitans]
MSREDHRLAVPVYDFDRVKAGGDLSISHTEHHHYSLGVVSSGALLSGRSLYVSQVRELLAPIDGLRGRKLELDDVAKFCRGEQPYMWIRAKPWAGKTALLTSFLLHPPPDLTVVGFFVTDRLADQNDHRAFTDAVLDQLAVLLPDHRALIAATSINRDGLRNELLALAARRGADAGRRLVLVVDGLDEDTGKPPIVSLLPPRVDPNLRVVVASRHGPVLPIPYRHPLASVEPYLLTSSPFAADVRVQAIAELDALLRGPEEHRDLLALITAANGLTASELGELTDMAPYEIDGLLRAVSGRSFRARTVATSLQPSEAADSVYVLAHETLQRTAEERLGVRQLASSLGRLHAWADQYRDLGWPVGTPDFLLRRYFPVLDRHLELQRMIAAGLDRARHDRMRVRTGGDSTALGEIRVVQQRICDQHDPDVLSTARLARHRDYLRNRNDSIPIRLLTVLARLGQHDRAEALAYSYATPEQRVAGIAEIVEVVGSTDPNHAARLTDRAQLLIETIDDPDKQSRPLNMIAVAVSGSDPDRAETIAYSNPYRQTDVLGEIAKVVALNDPDRAETIVPTISSPYQQVDVLARIAETVADSDRAARLTDRTETLTATITEPYQQAKALARIAQVVAGSDPDRAARLIDRAETLARAITITPNKNDLLARIAQVVAVNDPDRAETIAHTIMQPHQQVDLLAKVAEVVAGYDPDRAEIIVPTITKPYQQVDALARIAEAVAGSDPDRAARLTNRAETLVPTMDSPVLQVQALARIAEAVAGSDPDRAAQLSDRAETLAETNDDRFRLSPVASIAAVVAVNDPDRAEAIAHTITDPYQQADALAKVTEVVAVNDPDRAEIIAHAITDPDEQAAALTRVAVVVAGFDPDRAEAIAHTITNQIRQSYALAGTAVVVARADPDRAETIAHTITNQERQSDAFAGIAEVVARFDPDRAETIAHTIIDPSKQASTLARVAVVVAGFDPDRAEAIAHTITNQSKQASTLAVVAAVAAGSDPDPDRAARLADRAQSLADTITGPYERASTLARIVEELAGSDPDRAETIAHTIAKPYEQTIALAGIAWAIAGSDPVRATRLIDHAETAAQTITDVHRQPGALETISTAAARLDFARAASIAHTIADHTHRARVLASIAGAMGSSEGSAESHDRNAVRPPGQVHPRTNPTDMSKPSQTSKHLLAHAWSISSWETPIFALPTVDMFVLNALASDLLDEHP